MATKQISQYGKKRTANGVEKVGGLCLNWLRYRLGDTLEEKTIPRALSHATSRLNWSTPIV